MKPTCPINGKTWWQETLHILKLNKKYFIWVVDHHSNEVMIAQQDTPDDVNLTYYQLNEDSSKKVYNLFKKII